MLNRRAKSEQEKKKRCGNGLRVGEKKKKKNIKIREPSKKNSVAREKGELVKKKFRRGGGSRAKGHLRHGGKKRESGKLGRLATRGGVLGGKSPTELIERKKHHAGDFKKKGGPEKDRGGRKKRGTRLRLWKKGGVGRTLSTKNIISLRQNEKGRARRTQAPGAGGRPKKSGRGGMGGGENLISI